MVQVIVDVASDHDVEEDHILLRNIVEHIAGEFCFSAESISSHEFDSKGLVRAKMLVHEDL